MTLILVNAISVTCAFIMTFAAWELWRLTRATGVMVLFVACLYLTVVRLTIAGAETFYPDCCLLHYRSYLIVAFWPLMAVGFVLLLRSLRGLYRRDRRVSTTTYDGPDRRRK